MSDSGHVGTLPRTCESFFLFQGTLYTADEILAEDASDPANWIPIDGWSGTVSDREDLHADLRKAESDCRYEPPYIFSVWVSRMQGDYVGYSYWGQRIGDLRDGDDPGNDWPEPLYWCGSVSESTYPLNTPGNFAYPAPDLDEDEFQQGFRSEKAFKGMYGCTPTEYQAKYFGK